MAVRVVTDEVVTKKLTVGSAAMPSGITLYDEITKEPYCVKIVSGAVVPQAGACQTGNSSLVTGTLEISPPAGGETSTTTAVTSEVSPPSGGGTSTASTTPESTETATTTQAIAP